MDENLSQAEKIAKKFVLDLHLEAINKKCTLDTNAKLPDWYDEEKFKRGQQYFHDNRFGMMFTNLIGLLSLLAEPHGLAILDATGKSSTTETSKQRYIRTTLHMLTWFKSDLKENSLSWESLRKVRRYHFCASNSSEQKGLGHITILELSTTTFGFMGYAMTRPQMFGIKFDNAEDRESYLHFWAVVGHALGVDDKYNMCLFPVDVVTHICEIFRRYMFIPLLQVEQPLFKSMVTALVEGYSDYIPMMNYSTLIFETRRVSGIPGYQIDPTGPKEYVCRSVFTRDELAQIQEALSKHSMSYMKDICFTENIPLIEICSTKMDQNHNYNDEVYRKIDENDDNYADSLEKRLEKVLDLDYDKTVTVKFFNENEWTTLMNGSKLKLLEKKEQSTVLFRSKVFKNHEKRIFRYINEAVLSGMLYVMKKQQKKGS